MDSGDRATQEAKAEAARLQSAEGARVINKMLLHLNAGKLPALPANRLLQ